MGPGVKGNARRGGPGVDCAQWVARISCGLWDAGRMIMLGELIAGPLAGVGRCVVTKVWRGGPGGSGWCAMVNDALCADLPRPVLPGECGGGPWKWVF